MPTMPAGIQTVTVTGTLLDPDGTPATGSIDFIPSVRKLYVGPKVIVLPAKYSAPITSGGVFSVVLPANDDAGGNPPTGSTYQVVERVTGGAQYNIAVLAANGGTQDLSTLAPVASNTGAAVVVGPVGATGAPGATGATGAASTVPGPTGATGPAMSDASLAVAVVTGATKTALSGTYVALTGAQTIAGAKNFATAPTVNGSAVGRRIEWTTGRYYGIVAGTPVGASSLQIGWSIASAIWVPPGRGIDRISVEVMSVGAGSVIRLGMYTDIGGTPGTLVVDAGTVDSSTASGIKEVVIAVSGLSGGWYWLTATAQGGASPLVRNLASPITGLSDYGSLWADFETQVYFAAGVSGALPGTYGPPTGAYNALLKMFVRAA